MKLMEIAGALVVAGSAVGAVPAAAATMQSSLDFVIGTGSFYNPNAPFAECAWQLSCSASDTKSVVRTFQLFDPSLGTLTGIGVTLSSILPIGTEIFANGNGGTATATGSATYNVGSLFSGTIAAPTSTCTPFCNVFTPTGTQSFTVDATTTVPFADLASYIGTGLGSMTLWETVNVTGTTSNGGLIARTRVANGIGQLGWRGTVTFTYVYDAIASVPEPASMALLLGGFGLVAAWRRAGAAPAPRRGELRPAGVLCQIDRSEDVLGEFACSRFRIIS